MKIAACLCAVLAGMQGATGHFDSAVSSGIAACFCLLWDINDKIKEVP